MANPQDEKWKQNLTVYQEYLDEMHRFPGFRDEYHGLRLGQWFRNQYSAYHRGILPEKRAAELDKINPVWRGTPEERRAENKRMLMYSSWKTSLGPDDVPIDRVFSGERLHRCLSFRIYCCRDYMDRYEQKYMEPKGEEFDAEWRDLRKLPELFYRHNREAVFAAQFPNLDYRCFNLYVSAFSRESKDLFSKEELQALGRKPSLYETAAAMSRNTNYSSAEEMRRLYEKQLDCLKPNLCDVLKARFLDGYTDTEIAQDWGLSIERIRQIKLMAQWKLGKYEVYQTIAPVHPLDAQQARKLAAQNGRTPATNTTEISCLDLTRRAYTCLRRAGIRTVADLENKTERDLLKIPNFGNGSLGEVRTALAFLGCTLAPEPPEQSPSTATATQPHSQEKQQTTPPSKVNPGKKLSFEHQIGAAMTKSGVKRPTSQPALEASAGR